MTSQEVIDKYGFDPDHYHHEWSFNYYEKNSEAYYFYDHLGRWSSITKQQLFDGMFLKREVCDLSYLFGNVYFSTKQIDDRHHYYGMVIRHIISQKLVVIHRTRFHLFPFAVGLSHK